MRFKTLSPRFCHFGVYNFAIGNVPIGIVRAAIGKPPSTRVVQSVKPEPTRPAKNRFYWLNRGGGRFDPQNTSDGLLAVPEDRLWSAHENVSATPARPNSQLLASLRLSVRSKANATCCAICRAMPPRRFCRGTNGQTFRNSLTMNCIYCGDRLRHSRRH